MKAYPQAPRRGESSSDAQTHAAHTRNLARVVLATASILLLSAPAATAAPTPTNDHIPSASTINVHTCRGGNNPGYCAGDAPGLTIPPPECPPNPWNGWRESPCW